MSAAVSQKIHANATVASSGVASSRIAVTVLVAARNEIANIERCIQALAPAQEVVVLDSLSTDGTREAAERLGAKVIPFHYQGGYPKKRQWGLENLEFSTEWVLFVDADEVIPLALWEEIEAAVNSKNGPDAYLITKGFHFLGRRFRFGGFSFEAVLLARRGKVRFERLIEDPADKFDMEVHERVIVDGRVGRLKTPLIHEDFKGLEAYLQRHNGYSTWEARLRWSYLKSSQYGQESVKPRLWGNAQERRRFLKRIAIRTPGEPWLWFFYHYLFRLGFLEGRPGLIASQIRSNYIRDVRSKMYELSLAAKTSLNQNATAEDVVNG